jgi:tryptophan synthase alpha chain
MKDAVSEGENTDSSRIDAAFRHAKEQGRAAFIAYITCGDPTLVRTKQLAQAFAGAGVDLIEFGVPFSDPMADGTANQEAALRALEQGVTLADVLRTAEELRGEGFTVPIVLFTYFNPVFAYGVERFASDAAKAGVDGVLLLDVPAEESPEAKPYLDAAGVATVFLVAPTTTDERLPFILNQTTGFVYYVSRTGVTGERSDLDQSIRENVERIRRHTALPVAVGFGVSTPEHVREIGAHADGVIVGSAIVRRIGEGGDSDDMVDTVAAFVRELRGLPAGG